MMPREDVDAAVLAELRRLLDAGAKPEHLADAAISTGLAIAEQVAGPLAVARRLYLLALRFAQAGGLQPSDLHRTKH